MKFGNFVRVNLKVLKLQGFLWGAEKLTTSKVLISSCKVLLFLTAFGFIFHQYVLTIDVEGTDSWVQVVMYFSRVTTFVLLFIIYFASSLFYQRSKRLQFLSAVDDCYDLIKLHSDEHVCSINLARKVFYISLLHHSVNFTFFFFAANESFTRIYISISSLGLFYIFQNQCQFNFIIWYIYLEARITNEIIARQSLNPRETIKLKFKIQKVVELFNQSFGANILFEVFHFFINVTTKCYWVVGIALVGFKMEDLFGLILMAFESAPMMTASFLLFYSSEKVKNEVGRRFL